MLLLTTVKIVSKTTDKGIKNAYLCRLLASTTVKNDNVFPTRIYEINTIILHYLDIKSPGTVSKTCSTGRNIVPKDNKDLWYYQLKKFLGDCVIVLSACGGYYYNVCKKLVKSKEKFRLVPAVKCSLVRSVKILSIICFTFGSS